jgi:hypothetical protein
LSKSRKNIPGNIQYVLSAISIQKFSKFSSGLKLSFLLPTNIASLIAPMEVPHIISNDIPFFVSPFITPHPKAPNEPPP